MFNDFSQTFLRKFSNCTSIIGRSCPEIEKEFFHKSEYYVVERTKKMTKVIEMVAIVVNSHLMLIEISIFDDNVRGLNRDG